ncbi:putative HTH-type transcriptional regulator YurK [Streptococcus sp. NPS 308]|nr:putative HTH-type transcriptional regulator YurK [Streptococcus sp. NPS 308]
MAIPKYQYIKDELKNKIISGQFASGDKFYTEAELIAMYDVSSITVVRALNDLAKDGYIVRQQGKGTFVSRARKFHVHVSTNSLSFQMLKSLKPKTIKLLSFLSSAETSLNI